MTYFWCRGCNAEMELKRWTRYGKPVYQCPVCMDFVEPNAPGFIQTHRPNRWQIAKWMIEEYARRLRKVAS